MGHRVRETGAPFLPHRNYAIVGKLLYVSGLVSTFVKWR